MAQYRTDTHTFDSALQIRHETSIPVDRHGNIISGNYDLEIAKGKIPGNTVVFLSGVNSNVATSANESIWSGDGIYPWSTWDAGAATLYLVSASASDTNKTILVQGLDSNYEMQSEVVTLNGTTAVATTHTYLRLNGAINIGPSATVGQVSIKYGSSSGTVMGYINATDQMMRQSCYTVPTGYTAFSVYGDFSVSGGDKAQLDAHWRLYGGVFLNVYSVEVSGMFKADPKIPGAIPEKTDIDNRVSNGTNNLRVISNQQLLLVDNNYL